MEYFTENSSPPDGQVFNDIYVKSQSVTTRYLNVLDGCTFPAGTGITADLGSLTDVNFTLPEKDGQSIYYNQTDSKFENKYSTSDVPYNFSLIVSGTAPNQYANSGNISFLDSSQ